MRDQRIRDPVHNLIKFSPERAEDKVLWGLIQTPEFQRLRRIRQLGFSEFVYPGATHTRLSHALGAMQTARRMLNVFERNKLIGHTADRASWECTTLCAALLHDVGHGPFSHVFEEVSSKCGVKIHHEEWTRKIIGESSIAQVLKEGGPDLLEQTLSFFVKEPGYNIYSRIVSSQLDADRLDFLLRDRYFTGIKFGVIDPEWLFDCLRIEEVDIATDMNAKQFAFVVSSKGFSAAENYLYAYSEMYSKVYFHKTTRAAQFMMQDILLGILQPEIREKLPSNNPVRQYFDSGPVPTLDKYLKLDDYSIWALIHWASEDKLGEITVLAQRLLNRDLYKCFEPPHRPKEQITPIQAGKFESKLKEREIFYHRDRIPEKGYQSFSGEGMTYLKNILVYSELDQSPTAISSLSPWVEAMPDGAPIRFYFKTVKDQDLAKSLWKRPT